MNLLEQYPWLSDHDGRQAVFYINLDRTLLDVYSVQYKGIEDFIQDKDKVQQVYELDNEQTY